MRTSVTIVSDFFFSDNNFSKASWRNRVVVHFFFIKRTREINKLKKRLSNSELITRSTSQWFEDYLIFFSNMLEALFFFFIIIFRLKTVLRYETSSQSQSYFQSKPIYRTFPAFSPLHFVLCIILHGKRGGSMNVDVRSEGKLFTILVSVITWFRV